MSIGEYVNAFLDLFYPRFCLHCNHSLIHSYEFYLCEDCKKEIRYVSNSHCIRCEAALGPHIVSTAEGGCTDCKEKYLPFDTLTSIFHYMGVMKTLIHKFKYARQKFLSTALNDLLLNHEKLPAIVPDIDIIVPVPLHWIKKMHRGFNQSELLSRGIQKHFSKPLSTKNLCRIKNTASQTQLSKSQRQVNIHNAFFVNYPKLFQGKTVLLVDDVLTTGVTVTECSRKLKEAGAGSVHVLVLATARYPDQVL